MFVVTAVSLTVGNELYVRGAVLPSDLDGVDYDNLVEHKAVKNVNPERKNSRRSRKGSEGETTDGDVNTSGDK